jgi:hypothetical protein
LEQWFVSFRSGTVPLHPTAGLIMVSVPASVFVAFMAVLMSELALRTIIAVAISSIEQSVAFPCLTDVRA